MKLLFSSLLFFLVSCAYAQAPLSNQVTVRNQGNVDNYTGVKQVLISVPADAVNRIYNGSTLIFNDTTGVFEIDTLTTSGGAADPVFYEYMAVMEYNADSFDIVIDSIIINTFPSYFYRLSGGSLSGGFQLRCSDCGPTVDFTQYYKFNPNFAEFPVPSVWHYYDIDDNKYVPIYTYYTALDSHSLTCMPIKMDGSDIDVTAFGEGTPPYIIHFIYKIGS